LSVSLLALLPLLLLLSVSSRSLFFVVAPTLPRSDRLLAHRLARALHSHCVLFGWECDAMNPAICVVLSLVIVGSVVRAENTNKQSTTGAPVSQRRKA
jgi:hypothetical protein